MINGGRILHHIRRYIENTNSSLLIVGYQARGTMGRRILDGNREISVDDRYRAEEAATIMQLPPNREIIQVFAKNYRVDCCRPYRSVGNLCFHGKTKTRYCAACRFGFV